jgi:hypothetical protein
MRYFELRDDLNIAGRWHLGEITSGTEVPRLRVGLPFAGELTAEIGRMGKALDFSLTSFAVPVVTDKLGAAIATVAQTDLQELPLRIPAHANFEVLNALRIVACLDETKSMFTKWTHADHRSDLAGQYRMVTQLHVDPKRIPGDSHFFRIEGWAIALIVSERVKAAMEKVGCHGAVFADVT